jgi:hypothetical protein
LIVNLITLGGWVGWVLSTVLLGVSGSKGRSLTDGVTIGHIHLSCEMLVIVFSVCLIIVINAWLFGRLLKGAANSTADYKVVCDRLPAALQQEIDVKDAASPYVNQAAAEYCSSLDEAGFKQLLNSPDATCRNLNAGSNASKRDSGRKGRFFLKDHDYIVGASSLIEIASRLTTVGSEESKCWLKVEQEALKRAKLWVVDSAFSTSPSSQATPWTSYKGITQ